MKLLANELISLHKWKLRSGSSTPSAHIPKAAISEQKILVSAVQLIHCFDFPHNSKSNRNYVNTFKLLRRDNKFLSLYRLSEFPQEAWIGKMVSKKNIFQYIIEGHSIGFHI